MIFLHALPQYPFDSLKSDLLTALGDLPADSATRQALPDLPSNPSHISFAVLVDKNDPSQGWVPIDIPETEVEAGENGETRTVGGKGSVLNEDPQSAGLKDGAQIAFRFLTKDEISSGVVSSDGSLWGVTQPKFEDEGADLDDGDAE